MDYINDEEAEKISKAINSIRDPLVRLGWASGVYCNDKGYVIEWTPHGKEKMREAWEALRGMSICWGLDPATSYAFFVILHGIAKENAWPDSE